MKILCITHADFETPGVIMDWALKNQHEIKVSKPYRGENISYIGKNTTDNDDSYDFDVLILMGGPQSPLKLDEFPYLAQEIALVKQAVASNKIIIGFCLGAQLIGEALSGTTERSPEKEIGVYPITLTPEGSKDPLFQGFPQTFPVIHWHNDMPGVTENSQILAASAGCPRQIIRYDQKIYGFQCHMEITLSGIEDLIAACPEDLNASKFTQAKEALLQQDYPAIHQSMFKILDRLLAT